MNVSNPQAVVGSSDGLGLEPERDIVARLRDKSGGFINGLYDNEAADEIERLRAALAAIEDSEGGCASFVRPHTCWGAGRKVMTSPDMERAGAVCSHCIAARALRDAAWRVVAEAGRRDGDFT